MQFWGKQVYVQIEFKFLCRGSHKLLEILEKNAMKIKVQNSKSLEKEKGLGLLRHLRYLPV